MGGIIDIIFGGMEDSWDYDVMDIMMILVLDVFKLDEILFVIVFFGGTCLNVCIKGNLFE